MSSFQLLQATHCSAGPILYADTVADLRSCMSNQFSKFMDRPVVFITVSKLSIQDPSNYNPHCKMQDLIVSWVPSQFDNTIRVKNWKIGMVFHPYTTVPPPPRKQHAHREKGPQQKKKKMISLEIPTIARNKS